MKKILYKFKKAKDTKFTKGKKVKLVSIRNFVGFDCIAWIIGDNLALGRSYIIYDVDSKDSSYIILKGKEYWHRIENFELVD